MMAPGQPELALARFTAELRADDLPPSVAGQVKLLLLDAIASAFAGRGTLERPAMERTAMEVAGPGSVTVIGGGTLAAAGATLLNGYQITAATVCDVHRPTLCHVTPVVVPPLLAVAEQRAVDGPTLLAALAAGMEVCVRTGLAMDYPRFRARGWHSPGVVGPIGAAAGVARVLGLDTRATRDAMAFGASQSAGTFAALGSSQVKFHQARGAVSGLLAGLVAANSFDASERIFTAPDGGILATYADGGSPAALTDGLGERWELLQISMRRWPAASSIQAVVEAALDLSGDSSARDATDIVEVRVGLPEGSYRLNGEAGWKDQLSAFQSARYVAAVVLTDGRCWTHQFSAERIADPAVGSLAGQRISVSIDPSLPPSGASVEVTRRSGPPSQRRVQVPRGDPARPLSVDDVRSKLAEATDGGAFAARAAQIAELVLRLEQLSSVEELMQALRQAA